MKVLVVAPELPFPGVPHAGGQHLLRHLTALHERGHDIELWVPAEAHIVCDLEQAPPWLQLRVAPLRDLDRRRSLRYRVRRRLRFQSLAPSAFHGLLDAGLGAAAKGADIVELQWMNVAVLTSELRSAGVTTPIVVLAHDLTALTVPASARLRRSWASLALRVPLYRLRTVGEASDLRRADLVLVFKEGDRSALRALGVATPVHVIEPAIDPPGNGARRREGDVLFTGALWREANQHGLDWFLRQVWPEVAAQVGDARLVIAGAGPPQWLADLARASPRVVLTGTVPDLTPYYESSSVFVAPLFDPGGIKFKVPQAMAHGLPVVATSVAMAGVDAPDDAVWAVSDSASGMADAIRLALAKPDEARQVGERAAAWVKVRFSFERSVEQVIETYRRLVDDR